MTLEIACSLHWGTLGLDTNNTDYTIKLLGDLSNHHLVNILVTQYQISVEYRTAIGIILKSRISD